MHLLAKKGFDYSNKFNDKTKNTIIQLVKHYGQDLLKYTINRYIIKRIIKR